MKSTALPLILRALATVVKPGNAHKHRPDAPAYARRGSHPVGTREIKLADPQRPLNGTIWYPALNPKNLPESTTYPEGMASGYAIRNAVPRPGPFPLIIFSHGSTGFRHQSVYFTEQLASHGFVVMGVDHEGNTLLNQAPDMLSIGYADRPADVLRLIAYADSLSKTEFNGVIDMQQIGITGHSFGGHTALTIAGARLDFEALGTWCDTHTDPALKPDGVDFLRKKADLIAQRRQLSSTPSGLWPAISDSRIKAVVAMAPWNAPILGNAGIAAVTAPTMIIVGSKDPITVPERDSYVMYEHIGSTSKALVIFENGGHQFYVNECPPLAQQLNLFEGCSDPVWDMARAHDLINHFATAFFLWTIKGDPKAREALQGADFQGIRYQVENI
jgi:predicted dienelactone hydrolase